MSNKTRKTVPAALMLKSCLGLSLTLAAASGSAIALQSPASQINTPTLSATQHQAVDRAFAWHDRDSELLNSTITPRTIFVEQPGSMERCGRMAAKVKDPSDMVRQIALETAIERVESGSQIARGASSDNAIDINELVQNRMSEARARLAPSLIEGFMDVDVHTFTLPDNMTEEMIAEILMQTGDYEYVEPDWMCYPTATVPNDTNYNSQWWHGANRIDSERAWDYTTGSSDITIAVCDTGVDLDHSDLAAGIVSGFNAATNLAQVDGGIVSDYFGHGSMVAGCAAAQSNNARGVAGMGWNFKIMPVRVTNAGDGTAPVSDILQGARWGSDEGAYVSNCSYGGANSSQTRTTGNHIRAEGHLLVFSSGNDGIASQNGDWANVTIVGASTQSDGIANFSETGIGVDVIAPGTNILTTNRFGGYSSTQGTSFSAPITAGALALIHSANLSLSATEVEQLLFDNCEDKGAPGEDNDSGWGRINVGGSVFDAVFGPSVTFLPFSDPFDSSTLGDAWKNPVGSVDATDAADDEPTGDYSMNLDATDSIETFRLRAGFIQFGIGEVSFWTQHRGVEAGESLLVEYFDIFGSWSPLTTITSDGDDAAPFQRNRIVMPLPAKHDGLKLRFTAQGSDSSDDWYIDDVLVREFINNDVPWSVNFETGIDTDFDWTSSDASLSSDATNAPAGPQTALLTNAQSMTSQAIDAPISETVYVHAYTQHHGVENGETLDFEYYNALGNWIPLGSAVSDGSDPSGFTLNQWTLPFDGMSSLLQIRITADGDEADDRWYIDDVAVTTEFVIEDTACPADFTDDGVLDIFDVLGFINAFNAEESTADFTDDGVYDIFDVLGFISAFNSGCP